MKQSRLGSLVEQITSTVIGLVVALATQLIVFPWFGFNPPLGHNLLITAIFTGVSIVRGYGVRRLFEALHIRTPMSPFVAAVVAERARQVTGEGWDAAHDDSHKAGELAAAGASYALWTGTKWVDPNRAPPYWPWSVEWWKPGDTRRDLVKAAALICAEGDRYDRMRRANARVRRAF